MKSPILVTHRLPSSVMMRLEAACEVDHFEGPGAIAHDELVARVAGRHALLSMVTDVVDRSVIEAGAALRVIANVAVGYNNVDVVAARERGIVVTNTPDVLTDATADFTLALILAVTRRLGEGERMLRCDNWKGWAFDQLLGRLECFEHFGILGCQQVDPGPQAELLLLDPHQFLLRVGDGLLGTDRNRCGQDTQQANEDGNAPPGLPRELSSTRPLHAAAA